MARRVLRALAVCALMLGALALLLAVWLRPPRMAVPAPGLELSDVTLVNPGESRVHGQSVVVRGDRIERIGRRASDGRRGPYAGTTVLPGLIDLHVHHPPAIAVGERELFALLFLDHGVTTVRDAGSALPAALRAHAKAIAEGRRAGPRVFHCGPFLDGDPPDWPGAHRVRGAEEGRAAVRELAEAGVECVKLYNGLSPPAIRGILEAARDHSLPVVAHVPRTARLRDLPGVELQHLMGLTDDWERIPAGAIARYVQRSRALRIRHTPTLVTFARAAELTRPAGRGDDALGRLLPRYHAEILWRIDRNPLALVQAVSTGRIEAMKPVVAALHRAGVRILAGTDTMNPRVVPGRALHEELHHLVDAGLSAEEAWAAATRLAGEALGAPGLGRLEPGAPADLLIFDEDPTRDLRALKSLRAVVARGRLYPKEELDRAVEAALAHFRGFPYDPLSMNAASLSLSWITSW